MICPGVRDCWGMPLHPRTLAESFPEVCAAVISIFLLAAGNQAIHPPAARHESGGVIPVGHRRLRVQAILFPGSTPSRFCRSAWRIWLATRSASRGRFLRRSGHVDAAIQEPWSTSCLWTPIGSRGR